MNLRIFIAIPLVMGMLAGCETANPGGGNAMVDRLSPDQIFRRDIGDRVFFDYDAYTLRPDAQATLIKQAAWLKTQPGLRITIEGHADERGTREYNLSLGERRAAAVKSFLVGQGLPADRLNTISYGKERPEVAGSDEASWSRNRRAVTALSN